MKESEPDVKELLIGTLVNLSAESAMELLMSSPAMRIPVSLRSPDLYDLLQIFLHDTESWEISLFRVQRTIDLVLIREDTLSSATCALIDLSSFKEDLFRKPVSPPPPWCSYNASERISRPPSWHD